MSRIDFSFETNIMQNCRKQTVDRARHPKTRYHPAPIVDLRSRTTRERLSPSAVRAFFNILEQWKVPQEAARDLLGGVSAGTFYELKRNPKHTLDTDALT